MAENKTNQQKDKEMFEAYGGLLILFASLIILFFLTSPGIRDNGAVAEEADSESVEVATVVEEATEEVVAVVEETTEEPVVDEPQEEVADSGAAGDYDAESIANGELLFVTCAACHGVDGLGIQGLGKNLVAGEFALSASDEEIRTVITNGRPIWDPANTTMIDMPAKGGNPLLTADDIDDLIAYIRSLQAQSQ